MSTALALIETTQYEVMSKLAKVAAQSGYVGKSEVQAMFIMLKGMELGISPMQALDGIEVIQGKTTVKPQLMLALINRSGQFEDMKIDSTDERCTVTMTRKGRSPHTETFTMDNAMAMGLANKPTWKSQPATMLKWRAVSACARIVYPDVIQGMYLPEEMGADVSENESGDIVITAPVAPTLPANVEAETGEIVDAPLTIVDASKTDENAPSSDLPIAAGQTIARTPEQALKGNGADKPRRIAKDNAPTEGEVREFTAYQVRRLGTDPKAVYQIETRQHTYLTTYSRDIFRALGYSDDEMKDWSNVGFVGALKQDHPIKAKWVITGKFGVWQPIIPTVEGMPESEDSDE